MLYDYCLSLRALLDKLKLVGCRNITETCVDTYSKAACLAWVADQFMHLPVELAGDYSLEANHALEEAFQLDNNCAYAHRMRAWFYEKYNNSVSTIILTPKF